MKDPSHEGWGVKGGPSSVDADTALCREYFCPLGQTGLLQTKCLLDVGLCSHGPAVLPCPTWGLPHAL